MADTKTLVSVTIDNPAMGTASVVNQKLEYLPAANFEGRASGMSTIHDGAGQQSSAPWARVIGPRPNPPPVAVADIDETPIAFGTAKVIIDVLANDKADG